MISHNVKPLRHVKTAPILTINNTLLRSMQNTQKVITRLPSSSSFSNLIECDSYLLRFYTYTTGLPSKMVCPRHYQQEKMFLNGHSRQRSSSCLCHAGLSGILWKIYIATGHSCESSHVTNLVDPLSAVSRGLQLSQSLFRVLNGKVVYIASHRFALH